VPSGWSTNNIIICLALKSKHYFHHDSFQK